MTSGLTGEAAKALFDASYAVPASAVLANPSKYTSSDHIYTELGKLWAQTRRGRDSLPPAQAHEPVDGRTLDEDLEDCVYTANTAIWAAADPKPKINSTLVYNRPSSIRKKMNAALQYMQRAMDHIGRIKSAEGKATWRAHYAVVLLACRRAPEAVEVIKDGLSEIVGVSDGIITKQHILSGRIPHAHRQLAASMCFNLAVCQAELHHHEHDLQQEVAHSMQLQSMHLVHRGRKLCLQDAERVLVE